MSLDTTALAAATASAVTTADLWKQAVALVIETRRMGVRRVSTGHVPEGTDPKMVRLSKAILAGDQYLAIARADRQIRSDIGKLSLPMSAFFKGTVLIPLSLVEEVDRRVQEWQITRRSLVARFIEAYPALVEQARVRLGRLFDELDYPQASELPGLFEERVQYLSFDVPGTIDTFSRQAAARAAAEQKARIEEAVAEMKLHLRHSFLELVTHLTHQLEPDAAGRRKAVRQESVDRLLEFLEFFQARNSVAGDQELAGLVEKTCQLLKGVAPAELRSDLRFNKTVQAQMDGLKEQLTELLVPADRRRYDLLAS